MNVPKLRFPGFVGEWEERRLGDCATFFSGGTPTSTNKAYYEGDIPFIKSGEINKSVTEQFLSISGFSNSSAKMVTKGDLLFALYGATSGEVSISKIEGAINQAVLCIRSKHIDVGIMLYFFQRNKSAILEKYLQGGQGNLSAEIIKNLLISLPSLEEQQKITTFLSSVDNVIQLLTKKKTLLENYKKGIMQKIFSQEIRFKDEYGNDFPDWEEKRLDSIIKKFLVPMRDKPTELNGEIPWCRIEDFDGKYLYNSKSGQGVSATTVKNMNLKIYPIDTLIVSCSANLGICAIIKNELITNQTFIGLVPDHTKINVEFLFYVMNLSANKLNSLSSGTTISYLSREQFERFEISIPSLQEQQKIADFLSGIDRTIEIVNSQIEKTKEYKKGLLQQMFV